MAVKVKGRRTGTGKLKEEGITRVDVYWQSETMIACWVIWAEAAEEDPEEPCNLQASTQVRSIVRHKFTFKGLRRILKTPPKLKNITATLLADKDGGHTLLQHHQVKVSTLTREQNSFLQAQPWKYEQCLRCNERVHQHVGVAILAAGLELCNSKIGVNL